MVLQVWQFCGGWKPEVFDLAIAYYDVRDVGRLIDGLLVLRGVVDKRAALEAKA